MDPYDRGRKMGFSRDNARRVIGAVQRDERRYRNDPPPGRAPRVWATTQGKLALTSSTISAGSVTSPTSGTATILLFDAATGTTSTQETGVTVWNSVNSAIPSGSGVQLKVIDGAYFIDVVTCPVIP